MDWKRWVIISGTVVAIGAVGTAITPAMRFFLGDSDPYYTACTDDGDCGASEFCKLTDCAAPGRCAPTPAACDSDVGPICGCDGSVYWNSCQLEIAEESTDILNQCLTPMVDNSLLVDPAMFTGLVPNEAGPANTGNVVSGSKKWVSFYDLGPVEGLFGLTAAQDGLDNPPLNLYSQSGFTTRAIDGYLYGTRPPAKWMLDIQNAETYSIYIRRSSAAEIEIRVDEGELDTTGAAALNTNACSPCFDWWKIGQASLSTGVHWFDLHLNTSTWDVVLISSDTDFSPDDTEVQTIWADYDSDPQTYGVRYSRGQTIIDAAMDTDSNVPHWTIVKDVSDAWHEDMFNFEALDTDPVIEVARNHFGSTSFKILAGEKGAQVQLSLSDLHDVDSDIVTGDEISIRVVRPEPMHSWYHVSDQSAGNWESDNREIAMTLVHDARTERWNEAYQGTYPNGHAYASIDPYSTANFWVTVDPSNTLNDGTYTGSIHIRDLKNTWLHTTLPIHVEVANVSLPENSDNNGLFYIYSGNELSGAGVQIPAARFEGDLDYMNHLDLGTLTLQQGYLVRDTDNNIIINEYDPETAFAKGLVRPPTNMGPIAGQIGAAKALEIFQHAEATGFDAPYVRVYEYDEPNNDTEYAILDFRLDVSDIVEARVQDTDSNYVIEGMVTFNNSEACTVTLCDYSTPCDTDDPNVNKTFIERVESPLFNWVTPLQTYVDQSIGFGHEPRSYWTVQSTSPLAQRLTAGYQNQARGFFGAQPYAFVTGAPSKTYDEYSLVDASEANSSTYPDEFYNPIPTRRSEAIGEGLIDARYYQLLETWVDVTNGCAQYGDTDTTDTDPASTVLRASELFDIISTPYVNNTFVTRFETNYGPTKRRQEITQIVIELQNTWGASGPGDTDNIDTADCVDTGAP